MHPFLKIAMLALFWIAAGMIPRPAGLLALLIAMAATLAIDEDQHPGGP